MLIDKRYQISEREKRDLKNSFLCFVILQSKKKTSNHKKNKTSERFEIVTYTTVHDKPN